MAALIGNDLELEDGIEYPSSDGKPMAESEIHLLIMIEMFQMLRSHFASRADAYVIANMLWYWRRGDPSACSSPDVMVVFGVDKRVRKSFKTWAEGGAIPCVTIEMASESTWNERITDDKAQYERLGVKEYFIFDPESRFLPKQLMGYRLVRGRYVEIKADRDGAMMSRQLNLRLIPRGVHLRPADPVTGKLLQTDSELKAEAAEKAEKEAKRADEQAKRADEQTKRATKEAKRAKKERKRRELLEAELEILREQLRQRKSQKGDVEPDEQ